MAARNLNLTFKRVDGAFTLDFDAPYDATLQYICNDMKLRLSESFHIPFEELTVIKADSSYRNEYKDPIRPTTDRLVNLYGSEELNFYVSSRFIKSPRDMIDYFESLEPMTPISTPTTNNIDSRFRSRTSSPIPRNRTFSPPTSFSSTINFNYYPTPTPHPEFIPNPENMSDEDRQAIECAVFKSIETTEECPCCLENKINSISPYKCDHIICAECFFEWYGRNKNTCPLCRTGVNSVDQTLIK